MGEKNKDRVWKVFIFLSYIFLSSLAGVVRRLLTLTNIDFMNSKQRKFRRDVVIDLGL